MFWRSKDARKIELQFAAGEIAGFDCWCWQHSSDCARIDGTLAKNCKAWDIGCSFFQCGGVGLFLVDALKDGGAVVPHTPFP